MGVDETERIGGYAVVRKLGEGGMGTVYLARSRGGRSVAVKVARPELAADRHFRERFRAEVAAARRVGGFHTAPVVDADPDGDPPWLATAYIPGPTLSGLLAAGGPLDEARLRLLGAALAEALVVIHGCGLVHRDLKPGNIVMAPDGPRVLDFGIARAVESTRLTMTGHAFGTPGYLAPEQAEGLEVTGAADVFALGAVLVAAAGGRPFGDGTPMMLMYRSVHHEADVSAVPPGLRAVVAGCMDKHPARRPTPERLLDLLVAGDPADDTTVPVVADLPPTLHDPSPLPPVPPVPQAPPRPAAPPGAAPRAASPAAHATDRARAQPVFVASDERNRVILNARGVVLSVGPEEAEFAWDEVADVSFDASRRGRRLEVVVVHHDGSRFETDVNARKGPVLLGWMEQLYRALDHYLP